MTDRLKQHQVKKQSVASALMGKPDKQDKKINISEVVRLCLDKLGQEGLESVLC
jgi:hypothetical protein